MRTHRCYRACSIDGVSLPSKKPQSSENKDINAMNHLEPTKTGFQSFEHAAADIVLAASFNSSGTRAVLCSADHKIRVYNIDRNNDVWTLADQWRGHDAEVLDVGVVTPLQKKLC